MSNLQGTNVASVVVPFTDTDTYPTHDSLYGKGGYREVSTVEMRDALPVDRLREGCVVYVKSVDTEYRLINGVWTELENNRSDGSRDKPIFRVDNGFLEWKYESEDDAMWRQLFDMESIAGGTRRMTTEDYFKLDVVANNLIYLLEDGNGQLEYMYVGSDLIGRSKELDGNNGFPYHFPIIF